MEQDRIVALPGDLTAKAAIKLGNRLHDILNIRIMISDTLLELADEQVARPCLEARGITGCEVLWLPSICQYGVDGSVLSFSSLLSTTKATRMEDHQAAVVEKLLKGHYRDPIACTTFYYPTGAVMAVQFDPHKLANLFLAYILVEESDRA